MHLTESFPHTTALGSLWNQCCPLLLCSFTQEALFDRTVVCYDTAMVPGDQLQHNVTNVEMIYWISIVVGNYVYGQS